MKFLVVLSCVLVGAFSAPFEGEQTVDVTQDTLGNYKFAVRTADIARTEERLPDGSVLGEYSYPDANGVLRTYKYKSGVEGFQILEGVLPVAPAPVAELPELIALRNEHLALFAGHDGGELAVAKAVPVVPEVPIVETVPLTKNLVLPAAQPVPFHA